MVRIKLLRGEWQYDPNDPLGSGGFGDVFAGTADGYGPLAIKKINLTASNAAHRELRIAEDLAGRQLTHVMPVLDSGLDAGSGCYFVVMPRAERSLQDDLGAGTISVDEAAAILLQIANGLSEVSDIVHRDLKPGNVLYHDGIWKVTDFGIARFVEESTSLQTLKGCLSPQYAAPEQWRFEHATPATDIYALGCIGYALLTGQPPFPGPLAADFRLQHLQESPPQLRTGDPELRSLLLIMLGKIRETRPDLARVQRRLAEIAEKIRENSIDSDESGVAVLAEVGVLLVEEATQAEAKQIQERMKHAGRKELANEAWEILGGIFDTLYEEVEKVVPTAKRKGPAYLDLGKAALLTNPIGLGGPYAPGAFSQSGWDVIAGALIGVHQDPPEPSYFRSASLWYTDLGSGDGTYRWYEVSYYALPTTDSHTANNVPYALQDLKEADAAAAQSGKHRIATSPRPIDAEDVNDFYTRWQNLLATACRGELKYPRRLPLD